MLFWSSNYHTMSMFQMRILRDLKRKDGMSSLYNYIKKPVSFENLIDGQKQGGDHWRPIWRRQVAILFMIFFFFGHTVRANYNLTVLRISFGGFTVHNIGTTYGTKLGFRKCCEVVLMVSSWGAEAPDCCLPTSWWVSPPHCQNLPWIRSSQPMRNIAVTYKKLLGMI
jgi:hypothetical protein